MLNKDKLIGNAQTVYLFEDSIIAGKDNIKKSGKISWNNLVIGIWLTTINIVKKEIKIDNK